MTLPEFFEAMPSLDAPFPETVVSTRAVRAGTIAIDVFAEADRYPLKAR